ncbi:MAG: hypothetical protein ACLU6Y_18290 [Ruminococcus sp.]
MYTIKLSAVMVQNISTGPGQVAQKGLPWKSGRLGILKKTPVFYIIATEAPGVKALQNQNI